MSIVNAVQPTRTISDPIAEYESLVPLWERSRAACSGERFVKTLDSVLDLISYSNILIPFSPLMDQSQYNFYRAEAEWPGIVAQFSKMLIGGLLRKKPSLSLPKKVPANTADWIMNTFGQDDSSLTGFMDSALWEEVQTSRAWIHVDYPVVENPEDLSREERLALKPYPILLKAESVINWRTRLNNNGNILLDRVVVKELHESFDENEFHPTIKEVYKVHELDESGLYRIRVFEKSAPESSVQVINGFKQISTQASKEVTKLVDTIEDIKMDGERLKFIPIWPLNGSIDSQDPMLLPLISKEIAIYNKMSRRNHLLYGASTYTPYIKSRMPQEDFDEIVNSGLGTWIKLEQGDDIGVLETPTAALKDMGEAIASGLEEMSKMGVRMLTPEVAQSGVALDIRNAGQTAQLGTLSNKISNTMRQIICFMINWRYSLDINPSEIDFELSADFNPTPLGADWLRLITEWYEGGLIPRSIWLQILKANDIVDPEYDDEKGKQEINSDEMLVDKTPKTLYDSMNQPT